MLLHSDQCHLSSERLAQKLNHWGCASAFARKSHAPLWGAELLALWQKYCCTLTWSASGLTACQTAFWQPSADRLLWDGCYCHSQIICGRNPVFPVSYILLAMNFKCTGTEGKKRMVGLAAFFGEMTPSQTRMDFDRLGWYWLQMWRQNFTMRINVWHLLIF